MLITYKTEDCNIKSCKNRQHDLMLCSLHYNNYIIDKKIKEKLERLKRITDKKASFKDKIIYLLNFTIHYSTGVHVAYIEHFPLETIFIHFQKRIYRHEKFNFSIEQFISNFGYKENRYLDNLKIKFDSISSSQPLHLFVSEKKLKKFTLFYTCLWLIYFFIYLYVKIANIQISYQHVWDILVITFMIGIGMVHTGISFSTKAKELINICLENKLYRDLSDNKEFIKKSHQDLQQIRTMEENLWIIKGSFFAFLTSLIVETIYNQYHTGIYKISITLTLMILASILGLKVFSIMWNNRYIIAMIRHFHSRAFKFEIYALDQS